MPDKQFIFFANQIFAISIIENRVHRIRLKIDIRLIGVVEYQPLLLSGSVEMKIDDRKRRLWINKIANGISYCLHLLRQLAHSPAIAGLRGKKPEIFGLCHRRLCTGEIKVNAFIHCPGFWIKHAH